VWAVRKDDGSRAKDFYSLGGKIIGMYFRVNAEFANLSGNELGILRPKIKDEGFIHRWILAEGLKAFNRKEELISSRTGQG